MTEPFWRVRDQSWTTDGYRDINVTVKTEQVKADFAVLIEGDQWANDYQIEFDLDGNPGPVDVRGINISVQGEGTILKNFTWNPETSQVATPAKISLIFPKDWDQKVSGYPTIIVETENGGDVPIVNRPTNVDFNYTMLGNRIVGEGWLAVSEEIEPTDTTGSSKTETGSGATDSSDGGNSTGGPEDGGTGGGGDPDNNKTGLIVGVVIAVIAVIAIVVVVVVCVVRKRKARVFGDIDVNGDGHQETQNEENNDEPCDTHESGHCEDGGASCDPGERGGEGEGGQNDPEAPRAPEAEGEGDGPE